MWGMIHSLVIPVFNEDSGIDELVRRLEVELRAPLLSMGDDYQVIFVDDGSRDRSREILTTWCEKLKDRFVLVALSRNFGHQLAITAGLDFATGDTATVMDADLQDPPRVVLEMIQSFKKGHEVVFAVRNKRAKESWMKLFTAKWFYRILRSSTRLEIPLDTGDFRLMSRRALLALRKLRERHRFVRGMATWVGFKQGFVLYDRDQRWSGETKYPFSKMLKLAWDAFTGFSLVPLRLATYLGLFSTLIGACILVWVLYIKFFTDRSVQGWASMILVMVFFGGVQLVTIGVLGEYVGRIFEEVKGRPLYLVDQIIGSEQVMREQEGAHS